MPERANTVALVGVSYLPFDADCGKVIKPRVLFVSKDIGPGK